MYPEREVARNGFQLFYQVLMGRYDRRYNHSLSTDATIVHQKNFPIIGEHVVTIFMTQ